MKANTKKTSSHLKELVVVVLDITITFALDNVAEVRKAAHEDYQTLIDRCAAVQTLISSQP